MSTITLSVSHGIRLSYMFQRLMQKRGEMVGDEAIRAGDEANDKVQQLTATTTLVCCVYSSVLQCRYQINFPYSTLRFVPGTILLMISYIFFKTF